MLWRLSRLQLSDIHSGSWTEMKSNTKSCGYGQCPNKQTWSGFTGDICPTNIAMNWMNSLPILSQIKEKMESTQLLGNHDYFSYIKWNTKAEQQTNLDSLLAKEARMGCKCWIMNTSFIGDMTVLLWWEVKIGNPPFPNYGDLPKALKVQTEYLRSITQPWPDTLAPRSIARKWCTINAIGTYPRNAIQHLQFSPAKFVYPNTTDYTGKAIRLFCQCGTGISDVPHARLGHGWK